jgi:hypothetical protein
MKGWTVLPLPAQSKKTPPVGYTGEDALEVDESLALGEWMESAGNVALRLPDGVIGIDIDAYKDGGAGYAKLVKRLGALPETMGITSRANVSDGVTLFFSVPKGSRLIGSVETVDIIQKHHRYSVAPPSIHPEGRQYRWVSSSGMDLPWTPEPDEFPELPASWFNFLKEKSGPVKPAIVIREIPFEYESGSGCKKMNSLLKGAIIRLREGQAGRHDLMVLATRAMTCEAAKGHRGYDRILAAYEKAWQKSFSASERKSRPLSLEFKSAVLGAQRKISKGHFECTCDREAKLEMPVSSASLKMWR